MSTAFQGSEEMAFAEDPEFLRLLSEALQQQEEFEESGRPTGGGAAENAGVNTGTVGGVDVDLLCADHPEWVPAIRRALGAVDDLAGLQRASTTFDAAVGQCLTSRYRIDGRLGAGSMGVVYSATDLELRRPVAIKVVRSSRVANAASRDRFVREAEVLAAVRHASVVTVFDRGEAEDGTLYVVMERLDGSSLSELLEDVVADSELDADLRDRDRCDAISYAFGPDTSLDSSFVRQSVRWCLQLARGLEAVHEAGVVHRDIKPSNVFLPRDGRAVLIDFGIAARTAEETLSGDIGTPVGTPAYMAPERLDESEPTKAIDVYGLAATLYHLVTLRAPYVGTPTEVLGRLAKWDPAPARLARPGLPRDLEAILDKGLSRAVSSRYSSIAAFADDLECFLEHRPISARPVSRATRVTRRLARRADVRLAVVLAVIATLVASWISWRNAFETAQRVAFEEIRSSIPLNLVTCATGPSRVIEDSLLREQVAAKLDRMLEICPGSTAALTTRGCFAWDNGDLRGAARDFEALALRRPTPFLRSLADAYAASAEAAVPASGEAGAFLIPPSLASMPAPETGAGHYVVVVHRMREPAYDPAVLVEQLRSCVRNLAVAGSQDEMDARLLGVNAASWGELELLLQLETVVRSRRAQRPQLYREVEEAAIRLEQTLASSAYGTGAATVGTLNVRGAAQLGLERFEEAALLLEAAVARAPSGHGHRLSLGWAMRKQGFLAEAIALFEEVVRLRPGSVGAHQALALARIDVGDFEAAEAGIRQAPFGVESGQREYLLGKLEFSRALLTMNRDGWDAARPSAQMALDWFNEANSKNRRYSKTSPDAFSAQVIAQSTGRSVTRDLTIAAQASPLNWRRLFWLEKSMADTLGEQETAEIRALLIKIAKALDPAAFERLMSMPASSTQGFQEASSSLSDVIKPK